MRRPAPLMPLGLGLDAIALQVVRPRTWWERLLRLRVPADPAHLRPATPQDRLERYRDAVSVRPMYRDEQLELMREARGWPYLKAWRNGHFPRILRLRHLTPVPSSGRRRAAGGKC